MPDATPLSRALVAATGYCELGMWQDAWDELEALPAEDRAAPEVLRMRLRIFAGMEKWDSAAPLAEGMVAAGERDVSTFFLGARAIDETRGPREALAFLLGWETPNDECSGIHYLAARYLCRLGDVAGAKGRLEATFKLDPSLRLKALEEADLYPIW